MLSKAKERRSNTKRTSSNVHNHDRASHTSLYFTCNPNGESGNDRPNSKSRRKQKRKKIQIHMSGNTRNPWTGERTSRTTDYTLKSLQRYDLSTHSDRCPNSSDNESGSRRRIIFYDPSKRDCSRESGRKYATLFQHCLKDDKLNIVWGTTASSLQKSRRKCSSARKKVYRQFDTKDTCIQTEDHTSNTHEGCQASPEPSNLTKCCRGDECDLKGCSTEGQQRSVGVECNRQSHEYVHDTGHVFPFPGKTSSGTLKVPSEMVSFENESISVLVAHPHKTRLRHKEYNNRISKDGQEQCQQVRRSQQLGGDDRCDVERRVASSDAKLESKFPNHANLSGRKPRNNCSHSKERKHPNPGANASCYCREHAISRGFIKEEIGRNYSQEVKAWMASRPFLKSDEPTNCNHLQLYEVRHSEPTGGGQATSSQLPRENFDNMPKELQANSGQNINERFWLPPNVPAFPRDSTPEDASSYSEPFTSDTDGESSDEASNPTEVKIRNCKGTVDFIESLHYRIKRAVHPDTKIIIGDREFPLHSVALQIHSKYFDNLKRPPEAVHKIELPESVITPDDFQHVMDWILADEGDRKLVLTRDNVVGLYSTASHLIIPELKAHCLKFVQEKVDSDDPKLIKLWEESHLRPKTKELVSLLSQKLTTLFPKLYKTRQFLKLDGNELVTLLDSAEVVIDTEMVVFDAAVRWLLYDWPNRKLQTVKVMSTVRLGLLTPLQLTQMKYLSEDRDAPDLKRIFAFESVKKLLEDGLSYAIFKQSYENRAEEFEKWIHNSGIIPPKPRVHLNWETERPPRSLEINLDYTTRADDTQRAIQNHPKSVGLKSLEEKVRESSCKAEDKIIADSENIPTRDCGYKEDFSTNNYNSLLHEENTKRNGQEQDIGKNINVEYKQNEIRAAITIQSHFRGYLARKKIAQIKETSQTELRRLIRKVVKVSKPYMKSEQTM